MKTYLALALCLGLGAPVARAESGPKLEQLNTALPPLPGAADPSELLEEDDGFLAKMPEPPKSMFPQEAPKAEPKAEPIAEPKVEKVEAASSALQPIARRPGSGLTLPGTALQPMEASAAQIPSAPAALAPLVPPPQPAAAAQPVQPPLTLPVTAPEAKNSAPLIVVPATAPVTTTPPIPTPQRAPTNTKEKFVETKVSLEDPISIHGPEFAILLTDGKFRPARVRLRAGETSKILFTTLGPKPAALIIERLRVQKWLTRPEEAAKRSPASVAAPWEINRELTANRLTEIAIEPVKGNYTFHDAISGASGEIIVE